MSATAEFSTNGLSRLRRKRLWRHAFIWAVLIATALGSYIGTYRTWFRPAIQNGTTPSPGIWAHYFFCPAVWVDCKLAERRTMNYVAGLWRVIRIENPPVLRGPGAAPPALNDGPQTGWLMVEWTNDPGKVRNLSPGRHGARCVLRLPDDPRPKEFECELGPPHGFPFRITRDPDTLLTSVWLHLDFLKHSAAPGFLSFCHLPRTSMLQVGNSGDIGSFDLFAWPRDTPPPQYAYHIAHLPPSEGNQLVADVHIIPWGGSGDQRPIPKHSLVLTRIPPGDPARATIYRELEQSANATDAFTAKGK